MDFRYRDAEDKNRAAFRDGFFTAGDLGYLDDDGYLFIADRRTDLIITGGANVYPAEVESVLLPHPEVADVAVIGVPDAGHGQVGGRRRRAARRRAGHAPTRSSPSRAAISRTTSVRAASSSSTTLPREPQGKIRKQELVERYRSGRGVLWIADRRHRDCVRCRYRCR